ncbi:MAG: hypothetical protein U1D30_02530 [Planctomycetota bacterium]
MEELSRRSFSARSLGALVTASLVDVLTQQNLFADGKSGTVGYIKQINDLSHDLKNQKLDPVAWQTQVEEWFPKVDVPELLSLVDFEKLTKDIAIPDNGARSLRFKFRETEGLPTNLVFGKQIFALKKGRSVVPHGHDNMATAFLILKGDLRGRLYDRLEDEPMHYIIRPTIDRTFQVGECSTISDKKDNVHWFQAISEPAYIFNLHVLDVVPGGPLPTGRVYLDPNGEKLAGGKIRAPRINHAEAHKRYGASET